MSTAKPSVTERSAPVVAARRLGLAAVALLLAVVGLVWLGGAVQAQTPLNWQFQDLDGPDVNGDDGRTSNRVVPQGTSTVIYGGAPHVFYDAEGELRHAWWIGTRWAFETLDGAGGSDGQTGDPVGADSVAFLYGPDLHVFYFGDPVGTLRHAWYSPAAGRWFFESLDGPGAAGGDGRSANAMAGTAGWTIFAGEPHVFYQDTQARQLRHAWYVPALGRWLFESLDGPGVTGSGRTPTDIGPDMTAVAFGGAGEPHVFYRSGDESISRLRHAWYVPIAGRWFFENLDGPGVSGGDGRLSVATGFSPSAVIWDGNPHVFMGDGQQQLRQAWYERVSGRWLFNTIVTPAACGAGCAPGEEPSALVFGTPHVFHHDSAQGRLLQSWWTGSIWAFRALDGPGVSGGAGRTTEPTGASPSSVVYSGFPHVFNVDTTESRLRQAWFGPALPANTAAPTITGTAVTGQTLVAADGTWDNSPTTFTRQWLRCDAVLTTTCTPIAGQTATTYTVTNADIGSRIGLSVQATNVVGPATARATVTNVVAPPAPQITTVNPATGTNNGGTTVTITGQFLTGATSVTFGGVAGTSVSVGSDTQLTVVTPAVAPGAVDVVVTTPTGSVTAPGAFTFTQAPPAVISAPAVSGNVAVGSTLTVSNGTWAENPTSFAYAWQRCELLFGIFENCLGIEGATTNTYVVARADIGFFLKAFVSATNAGGTTPAAAPVTATVPRPAPQIVSLDPATGTNNGGTAVTITGDYLTFSTGATFGTEAGVDYTVVDEFTATVTTPENVTGPVDVVIASAFGDSDPFTFTYTLGEPVNVTPPAITGTVAIGEILSVSDGTWTNEPGGFTYQWQRCAGEVCTNVPTEEAATYDVTAEDVGFALRAVVTATNAAGSSDQASARTDVVDTPEPRIDSLTPTTGPESGGTSVVITGQYFTGATDVSFGVESVESFSVDTDTQITAVTPPGAAGAVAVSVTTPQGSDVEVAAFTYVASAPVNTVAPVVNGVPSVGVSIDVTTGTWVPTPDSYAYQWFRCDTECSAIEEATDSAYSPSGADVGFRLKAAVTASNAEGSNTAESAETSVISDPAPIISSVNPPAGPTAGGTVVTLTGQFFTGVTAATVGGEPSAFSVIDDTTMTVTTPPFPEEGPSDIVVTNAVGPSAPASFEYSDAPFVATEPSLDNPTPAVGATVTVDPGVWTGEPTFTYQWFRCSPFPPTTEEDCNLISGAESASYTVTIDDAGFGLVVLVTATNAFGSTESGAFAEAVVPAP